MPISTPWYLLYGGESADGMGPGKYLGRTLDPTIALRHLKRVEANPYSTGYVDVVLDRRIVHGLSEISLQRQGIDLRRDKPGPEE